MQTVTTICLDIAKSVFQVHGVDAAGQVVIRRQLKRRYVLAFFEKLSPCLVGIEACASSHYWSRELQAIGHSAEFGITAPIGRRGVEELLRVVADPTLNVAGGSFTACAQAPTATSDSARTVLARRMRCMCMRPPKIPMPARRHRSPPVTGVKERPAVRQGEP
jgi:hypothetical protein